jgi:signal peptidase II
MSLTRTRWREALLVVVAAAVLGLDQLSKAAVVRYLELHTPWNPVEPLRPFFSLTYVTNTGAAFGLFPQLGNLYVVIALVIIAGLLVFYRRFAFSHRLMQVCLGLQVGGALGNLVDRLRFGYVIDFLDFKVWPIFNVADSSIVVGVVILAILLLREDVGEKASERGPGKVGGKECSEAEWQG